MGDEISFYYDPMIAKIISKSENRTESINNMVHYLSELEIEGINTNKSFLISVLKNENFENANYNTKFIENNLLENFDYIQLHGSETEKRVQEIKNMGLKIYA